MMSEKQIESFQNGAFAAILVILIIIALIISKKDLLKEAFTLYIEGKYANIAYYILLVISFKGLINSVASILNTEGYKNNIYRSKIFDLLQGFIASGLVSFINSVLSLITTVIMIILAYLFYKFIKQNNVNNNEEI